MKLIFQSQLADSSGFGRAARQYYRILKSICATNRWELKVLVVKADVTVMPEHKIWEDSEELKTEEEIKSTALQEGYYYFFHSNLNYAMRQNSIQLLASRSIKTYCITVWESNSIFPNWENFLRSINCRDVIVPSKWNESVFLKNTTDLNIHYIPHYDSNTKKYSNSNFKLLSISQDNQRKNWKNTIKAFYNAFHNEDVEFIIKTNGNLQANKKIQDIEKNKFIQSINEIKSSFPNPKCKIRLIYSIVSEKKMESLYESCTHYFSMTHGEGFGFGILEAKSRGLTIIAPNKGGHIDFCNKDDFLFDAKEEYIDQNNGVFPSQSTWFCSTVLDAAKALVASKDTFETSPISNDFKFDSVIKSFKKIIHANCSRETKACANITNRFVKKNPCCIRHMEDLLIDIVKEMDEHNILYWVDFGTLLGLIRDGGIIPWDNDVDLCIMKEDAHKLELIKESLVDKGYHWDGTTGFGEKHNGLFRINTSSTNLNTADIYYWNEKNGTMIGECFEPDQFTFPFELIEEFVFIDFKGIKIRAPKRYEELLTIRYGDWKKPVRMGYH